MEAPMLDFANMSWCPAGSRRSRVKERDGENSESCIYPGGSRFRVHRPKRSSNKVIDSPIKHSNLAPSPKLAPWTQKLRIWWDVQGLGFRVAGRVSCFVNLDLTLWPRNTNIHPERTLSAEPWRLKPYCRGLNNYLYYFGGSLLRL